MEEKDWSVINKKSLAQKHQRSLVWKQLNSKKPRGDRQAYCRKSLSNHHCLSVHLLLLSALCVERWEMIPWKNKIKWHSENNHFKELNRINGTQTEFQWKYFPGFTTLGILEEIRKLMECIQCEPEHFNDRIIFMSTYHDIAWWVNGNTEKCVQNSIKSCEVCSQVPLRSLVILGTSIRKEVVRGLFW